MPTEKTADHAEREAAKTERKIPVKPDTHPSAPREEAVKDPYRTSRILYIIEAALEYFVAILVGETYLAKIATTIGISDSGVGVLSAFVSLGHAFQIFAIFLSQKKSVKRRTVWFGLLNQLLFTFIYVIPLFPSDFVLTVPLFVGALLLAQIIMNIINPGKINWYMSLVPDKQRGVFTANKEIVSLISGMAVSLVMGRIIDHFEDKGDIESAFLLIAITLLLLTILHTLTLIFSKEKPKEEAVAPVSTRTTLSLLFRNKTLYRVIGVSVIWAMINYSTAPFYGTYRIGELGFSMTFNAILTMLYSIVRATVSRPIGRFADKYSFKRMLLLCYGVKALAFLFAIFTVPTNGNIMFTAYYILAAISMAGINSSEINLIYDYVEPSQRTGALAIKYMLSGVIGFLTTLLMTIPVSYIQKNQNQLFGIPMYAQQFTSLVGLLGMIGLILYVKLVVRDKKATPEKDGDAHAEDGAR